MVAVRVEGPDPERTASAARLLGDRASSAACRPSAAGVRLLGPAPAPIARIKGKTRWQLLLKGPTHASLAPLAAEVLRAAEDVPASVKVAIDVDPGAML